MKGWLLAGEIQECSIACEKAYHCRLGYSFDDRARDGQVF